MEMSRTSNDLRIFKGSMLGHSHQVEGFLGEGGFGFVTKCHNMETDQLEAIKVNKSHPDVVHQARREIAILKRLRHLDPDTANIVKWNGFFFAEEHICISFELLNQSLWHYIQDKNRGLTTTELRPILHQMATALTHLKSEDIIHADVKPENIMVVDRHQNPLKVKLIDFGLAHPVSAAKPGVCLQTTWYRAPEIMLHMPYNEAIDMWSLGLVAAELATGYPLYPGDTDYDVLSFLIETQGQPSDSVLDRGMGTEYYFKRQENSWEFKTPEEFEEETGVYHTDRRDIRLRNLDDLVHLLEVKHGHNSDHHLLVDLIKQMLQVDPDKRIKPLEVLQHPFFTAQAPADICIDIIEEENPEVEHLHSWFQTTGPESNHYSVEGSTTSLTAQPEEKKTEEVDVQPENNENVGWFRRFLRGVTEAFHFYFLRDE